MVKSKPKKQQQKESLMVKAKNLRNLFVKEVNRVINQSSIENPIVLLSVKYDVLYNKPGYYQFEIIYSDNSGMQYKFGATMV